MQVGEVGFFVQPVVRAELKRPVLCTTFHCGLLQGIRIIKLFAWERDFMSKIDKSRRDEMRSLRSYMVSESALSLSLDVRDGHDEA